MINTMQLNVDVQNTKQLTVDVQNTQQLTVDMQNTKQLTDAQRCSCRETMFCLEQKSTEYIIL